MVVNKKTIQSIGKRKRSIARATLYPGKGVVRINSKYLEFYSPEISKQRIMEPLLLSEDTASQVNINVKVSGGGFQGQTDAVRTSIARALVIFNKKLKKTFLDYDRYLIVNDTRIKEQRKPNDSKARAARQKSYR